MEYDKLIHNLMEQGFERVERDDRLLDVFPTEIREKGIELWQRWRMSDGVIELRRITLPLTHKQIDKYTLPLPDIERALLTNTQREVSQYKKDPLRTEVRGKESN